MNASENEQLLQNISHQLCESYRVGPGVSLEGRYGLPQRENVVALLLQVLELLFPGYSGRKIFTEAGRFFQTGELLHEVYAGFVEQITRAITCRPHTKKRDPDCFEKARCCAEKFTAELLNKLAGIRELLKLDIQAALDGDPATKSADEIILAYPGFKAICIYRIAHELYQAPVPLIPRIMSEYAHTQTGIDINPGAKIGTSFFIDHGTGVVVGETAVIGDGVKLYQGVTLGALSFPKDFCGKLIKNIKRHPNIEDDVTIYAGATILGNVTIGKNSVIGGNVWLTKDIVANSKVTFAPADNLIRKHKKETTGDK